MDFKIYKENSFHQAAANMEKMGAYYTDLNMCRRIGYLFNFDEAEEICALEPSAGDGEAILAVTGKEGKRRENVRLFLVEMNTNTFNKHLKDNENFDYVLCADFLNGVRISNNKFSFSFANWPYGTSTDEKKRIETQFLEKQTDYMSYNSFLVTVVPYACITNDEFIRKILSRYHVEHVYRFDDDVYQQFKQCVIIARKKITTGYKREDYEKFCDFVRNIENFDYLPKSKEEVQNPYVVKNSYEVDISTFTEKEFIPEDNVDVIRNSYIFKKPEIISRMMVPEYQATNITPVMPLTKDMSYICAVQGIGEGLTGSVEEQDLHLQRGVIRVVTTRHVEERGDNNFVMVEKTHSKLSQTIVENDGKITELA